MPIRNHVEAIVQLLNENLGFAYGTANELNLIADSTTFPCAFMYPLQPVILSPQINGAIDNTYTLYIEFLYKTEFGQYAADNEIYVAQALQMANQFVIEAARYRHGPSRFFKIKAGDKAQCVPVYNKFDVNTTGVGLTITLATANS